MITEVFGGKKQVIAVDLDATLAEYNGWLGESHIGAPIKEMVELLKSIKELGHELWIFTARLSNNDKEKTRSAIITWLEKHDLAHLFAGITCEKSHRFTMFLDDRAYRVEANTGIVHSRRTGKPTVEEALDALGITKKAYEIAKLASMPCFNKQHGGSHYKDMLIEPALYAMANKLNGPQSNVVKYATRYPFKNGLEDIRKASHNLEFIAQLHYGEEL